MHYIGFNIRRATCGEVEYVRYCEGVYDGGILPAVCGRKSIYTSRGIEVGNIFQLGTKYTETMNMTYVDADGSLKNPIMGCYGIGVGRAMPPACCEAVIATITARSGRSRSRRGTFRSARCARITPRSPK